MLHRRGGMAQGFWPTALVYRGTSLIKKAGWLGGTDVEAAEAVGLEGRGDRHPHVRVHVRLRTRPFTDTGYDLQVT